MQSCVSRDLLHFAFPQISQRKENARQDRAVDFTQEIALILFYVDSFQEFTSSRETRYWGREIRSGVVAGSDIIRTGLKAFGGERFEFDEAIAQHVGIGRVSLHQVVVLNRMYIAIGL